MSSVIYEKARQLMKAGAIGELNMVEAWWDRNSAIGAWQYSIPPDATPENIDWDRFLGPRPKRPFEPIRLFRWRNYQDYGTGVAGDLFVHLFSAACTTSPAPSAPHASTPPAGCASGRTAAMCPTCCWGCTTIPRRTCTRSFTLALRVNFVSGAGETSGFRFVGSEGVMTIGGSSVTLNKVPREKEPGYTIETFPKAVQEQFLKEYRAKYPNKWTRRRIWMPRAKRSSWRPTATATIAITTPCSPSRPRRASR